MRRKFRATEIVHGFFHKYLVFDLKSTTKWGACSRSVSIEKLRSGLLFQIAKNHETVKSKVRGTDRKSVKLHNTSRKGGFDGALVGNLVHVESILESFETTALYDLLTSNCQHEVSSWQRALAEKSLSLNFHVPGGGEPIPVNDERIVGVVSTVT